MNVADDKNMDNFDEIILENDFEVYKKMLRSLWQRTGLLNQWTGLRRLRIQ